MDVEEDDNSSHPTPCTKCSIVRQVRETATELQKCLSYSPGGDSNTFMEELDSFTDLGPVTPLATTNVTSTDDESLPIPKLPDYSKLLDQQRAETLSQYSMIQTALEDIPPPLDTTDLAETCHSLLATLSRVINSVSAEGLSFVASEYERACRENEALTKEAALLKAQSTAGEKSANVTMCGRPSRRGSWSAGGDLNKTDVFEVMEKMCEENEEEHERLEAEAKKARDELLQSNGTFRWY